VMVMMMNMNMNMRLFGKMKTPPPPPHSSVEHWMGDDAYMLALHERNAIVRKGMGTEMFGHTTALRWSSFIWVGLGKALV
jgi:hypothetical protein